MSTLVAKIRRPILPADERYKDAIDALRKAFGRRQGFEEAKAWALRVCNEVEHAKAWQDQHQISQQERLRLRGRTSAAKAAVRLARDLEINPVEGVARVNEAARRAGVKLIADNKEAIDEECFTAGLDAFTKMLREIAKQPSRLHQRSGSSGQHFLLRPLLVIPPDKRFSLPSKPMSLAFALIYGFRKATGAIERKPNRSFGFPGSFGFYLDSDGSIYHRFDILSGGRPCYGAVKLFVNTTFNTTLTKDAIIKSLNRHKRRIHVMCSLVESPEGQQGQLGS
jgi:hypothetical protein